MSTRSKYIRVRTEQEGQPPKAETDIIMKFSPSYGKYISRALTLLIGDNAPAVTVKAAERLMDKALWVAEIIRKKVEGLHQIVTVSEQKIVDVYEPTEEGLIEVREERTLTVIEVVLTRTPTEAQTKAPGYHAPVKEGNFLTKEAWEREEKERAAKREERGDREGEKREERGERREERGGERRRGRKNE